MSTSIRQQMQAALRGAMQAREQLAVSVLRSTLAAIANAEAVDLSTADPRATEVERKHLSEADVVAIVTVERDQLRVATAEMESLGQPDKAADLAKQAAILDSYLG